MACAMIKACCGKSLLTVAHVLLYVNLILDVLESWYSIISKDDPIYSYLLEYSMASNIYIARMSSRVVEILVFLAATLTIIKRKPSSPLLIICVVFVLLEMFYYIYALIELNCANITSYEDFSQGMVTIEDKEEYPDSNDEFYDDELFSESPEEFFHNRMLTIKNKEEFKDTMKEFIIRTAIHKAMIGNKEEYSEESDPLQRSEYSSTTTANPEDQLHKIRIEYSNTLYGLDLAFGLILIFKAYSALVIYNSIVQLNQITSNDLPRAQQDSHRNVEKNVTAPPPAFNAAQFIQSYPHVHLYPAGVQCTQLHPNSQPSPLYPAQPSVNGVGSN
ncbi:uncharacterized protein LOC135834608 [Planococcus citri]|uniref:uncharacterized protein LOC135834608 n=1 Tax=Planococcus citri TaxID=170843 RepID=UPI0031F9A500